MFSRVFPAYHPRKGEPTFFVEKIMAGLADCQPDWKMLDDFVQYDWYKYYNCTEPKFHTIRAGKRWKVGDFFVPKIWMDKPYRSKQLQFAPPIEIKNVWSVEIQNNGLNWFVSIACKDVSLNKKGFRTLLPLCDVAVNDGLECNSFQDWFNRHSKTKDKLFTGQIICWNENIKY